MFLSENCFLCCINLYYGCIFIGISGLLISIVGLVYVISCICPEASLLLAVLAIIFLIIYFLGKIILLIGIACVSFNLAFCANVT